MTDADESGPFLLCSQCRTPCTGADAHVIPHWNQEAGQVLTTYRCGACWLDSLDRVRGAVKLGEPALLASFWDFLARHGYTKDLEALRAAPAERQQTILLAVLDAVQDGRLTFAP